MVAPRTAELPRVRIDTEALIDRLRGLEKRVGTARTVLRLSTCPFLEVTYESLVDGDREFHRVLEFLGVAPSAGLRNSTLVKRSARDHRESIANYDDVRKALAGTAFQELLN